MTEFITSPATMPTLPETPPSDSFWDGFNLRFGVLPAYQAGSSVTDEGANIDVGGSLFYSQNYRDSYGLGFYYGWSGSDAKYTGYSGGTNPTYHNSHDYFRFTLEKNRRGSPFLNGSNEQWGAWTTTQVQSIGHGNVGTTLSDPENEYHLSSETGTMIYGNEYRAGVELYPASRFAIRFQVGAGPFTQIIEDDQDIEVTPWSPQNIRLMSYIDIGLGDAASAMPPVDLGGLEFAHFVASQIVGVFSGNGSAQAGENALLAGRIMEQNPGADPGPLEEVRFFNSAAALFGGLGEAGYLETAGRANGGFRYAVVGTKLASAIANFAIGSAYEGTGLEAAGTGTLLSTAGYLVAAIQDIESPADRKSMESETLQVKGRNNLLWRTAIAQAAYLIGAAAGNGSAGQVIRGGAMNATTSVAFEPDPFVTGVVDGTHLEVTPASYYNGPTKSGSRGGIGYYQNIHQAPLYVGARLMTHVLQGEDVAQRAEFAGEAEPIKYAAVPSEVTGVVGLYFNGGDVVHLRAGVHNKARFGAGNDPSYGMGGEASVDLGYKYVHVGVTAAATKVAGGAELEILPHIKFTF